MLGIDNQDLLIFSFAGEVFSQQFKKIYFMIMSLVIFSKVIYFQIYGYLL